MTQDHKNSRLPLSNVKFDECKDCQKRQVGCHSQCRAYLEFSKAAAEDREKRYQERQQQNDAIQVRFGKVLKRFPNPNGQ